MLNRRSLLVGATASIIPVTAFAQYMGMPGGMSGTARPKAAPGTPATNPKEIEEWYEHLKNKHDGSCCGHGDAYPIIILKEAAPGVHDQDGVFQILDMSAREVVLENGDIIKIPAISKGQEQMPYSGDDVVWEKYGNPLKTAIAFLNVDEANGRIVMVYCVVPLPPTG